MTSHSMYYTYFPFGAGKILTDTKCSGRSGATVWDLGVGSVCGKIHAFQEVFNLPRRPRS